MSEQKKKDSQPTGQNIKKTYKQPGAMPIIEKHKQDKKWPSHPGIIAEEKLSPQLGSNPDHMQENQQYDIRILTNLNPLEVAWTTFADLMPDHAGGLIFKEFANTYRFNKRSQGGWTSKNILMALANLRGSAQQRDIARKPSILARNLWERDWRERAIEGGKEVVQE